MSVLLSLGASKISLEPGSTRPMSLVPGISLKPGSTGVGLKPGYIHATLTLGYTRAALDLGSTDPDLVLVSTGDYDYKGPLGTRANLERGSTEASLDSGALRVAWYLGTPEANLDPGSVEVGLGIGMSMEPGSVGTYQDTWSIRPRLVSEFIGADLLSGSTTKSDIPFIFLSPCGGYPFQI